MELAPSQSIVAIILARKNDADEHHSLPPRASGINPASQE
jgi:hypothetical protein